MVQVGSRDLQLHGCQLICVRNFMSPQCCPQHWGALCLRGSGGFYLVVFSLQDGFSGFSCQNCKNPNAYGEKCDKVCDCEHGVCNAGPEGDGQCLCQPPYTGRRCDHGESKTLSGGCSNCPPYSFCKGDGEAASCECLPGYRRNNQNKCTSVCSQRDCDVNAQCSSQGSRISCVCKPDYEGDGRVCLPRNPCSDNNGGCPSNSTVCVFKGANKVSSGPNPGGTGPGSVSDPVLSDTCHSSATCRTELDGRPRCVCEASEIGDGWRCYGNLMERLMELDRSATFCLFLCSSLFFFTEKGCSLLLSYNGPFTAFVPLLKTPLTVRIPSFMFILMEEPSRFYSVVLRDLPAANGIIHIIDRPIPVFVDRSFDIVAPEGGNIKLNSESFNHSSVSLFLQNCGSPPPLKGPGPITVFVPTNQAIDRARDGSILFFMHLQLTVDDLSALPRIQTMANQMITIRVSDDGRILLGDKRVQLASTNIMASNGVIHMIDGLLFPPSILPILPHRCDVTESKITVVSRGRGKQTNRTEQTKKQRHTK
uniref:Stabilin 1 n=1 Tax=Amphiprion percula TaxID=161767 RepID=A0A3P8U8B4_AMPPE